MITDLPAPDHTRLAAAPLEVVVWQLQFAEPADVSAARVGQHLSDALADVVHSRPHLTRLLPPTFAVAVGSGGAPSVPAELPGIGPQNGWQVRAGELVSTISHAALALETTKFEDWDSFRSSVAAILDALAAALPEPPGEQRLGLRYVDRISRPEVAAVADWGQWLQPWLLGPASHPQLGEAVIAMAQQIDCDAGDGMRVTVRQRAFDDPERRSQPTVLLDFDAFREGYRAFARDDLLAATDNLNDISHRLFRAAITDRLYETLREEPETR
jgi:uncharacterized protein (TIGR04255 family)